jgi:putative ABC transport system ATP-binding protein
MSRAPTYATTTPVDTDWQTGDHDRAGASGGCPAVLELREVTKTYGSVPPVPALRGVSLTVHQGELVAIVGPSGSGKTTLLHIIGTLDRPTSGAVRIDGIDLAGLDDRQLAALRARSIGFVFQQFFLAEHQTVLENVADGLLYAGVDVGQRRGLAAQALTRVGLTDRHYDRPTTMSGGQRQRIAIARALVGRPAIVLADEPTGNLDTHTGEQLLELLRELNADGATIIVITHDHGLANQLHRQVHMRDGLIVSDSTSGQEAAAAGGRKDDQ